MIREVMHNQCGKCGRHEPAQIGRIRYKNDHLIDTLVCLGCGAKWRNHHRETRNE